MTNKITLTRTVNSEEPALYVVADDALSSHKAKNDYQCTGENDDIVIQSVIDDYLSEFEGGGSILLSEGTFNLTDEIDVPSHISISGVNRSSTKLVQATADKSVFTATDTQFIELKNMYLEVPSTGAGDIISYNGGGGSIIENITVKGGDSNSWALHLSDAFSFSVSNFKFYSSAIGNGICIDNTDNKYHYGNGRVSNVSFSIKPGCAGIGLYGYPSGKSCNLIDFSAINIVASDGTGSTAIDINGGKTCNWSMLDLEVIDSGISIVNSNWNTFTAVYDMGGVSQVSIDEDSRCNTFVGLKIPDSEASKHVTDDGDYNVFVGGNYTP